VAGCPRVPCWSTPSSMATTRCAGRCYHANPMTWQSMPRLAKHHRFHLQTSSGDRLSVLHTASVSLSIMQSLTAISCRACILGYRCRVSPCTFSLGVCELGSCDGFLISAVCYAGDPTGTRGSSAGSRHGCRAASRRAGSSHSEAADAGLRFHISGEMMALTAPSSTTHRHPRAHSDLQPSGMDCTCVNSFATNLQVAETERELVGRLVSRKTEPLVMVLCRVSETGVRVLLQHNTPLFYVNKCMRGVGKHAHPYPDRKRRNGCNPRI